MSSISYFKARVTLEGGHITIDPYYNRRCPCNSGLSDVVRDYAKEWNGDLAWRKVYIRFEHQGITYEQIDQQPGLYCAGCIFYPGDERGGCTHPYYDTKGRCGGKIYVVRDMKKKVFNKPEEAEELKLGIIQAGEASVIKINLADLPNGMSVDDFLAMIKERGICLVDEH